MSPPLQTISSNLTKQSKRDRTKSSTSFDNDKFLPKNFLSSIQYYTYIYIYINRGCERWIWSTNVAEATGGIKTIFRMEIKTTRNGPFSIRPMHLLHSVSVNQPTRFHEMRLTFPLAEQVSTTLHSYLATLHERNFTNWFDIFRNSVAVYIPIYTDLEYHEQRLQIFDPFFPLSLFPSRTLSRNKYKERSEEARGIMCILGNRVSRERFRERIGSTS